MIDCVISTPVPTSQYIEVQLKAYFQKGEDVRLQLAAWRPGKYHLANYAQYVRGFKVWFEGQPVKHAKTTKDLWEFKASDKGSYTITYEYFAAQMDAGGSWLDTEQLYINFINLFFSISGKENSPIKITLKLPPSYKVATALPSAGTRFQYRADHYQHLVDSPLIASADIQHYSYRYAGTVFYLWCQGESSLDVDSLIPTFKAFTARQITDFGDFPAKEYHFLFQFLPYPHYHGVEHKYSTVITLGPADKLNQQGFIDALVGVSSHELYHFWNVCRIRPKELLPYDFSKEAYLDVGWLLEGITTYLGDLYLLKSGYYSLEKYLGKFQKLMDREFNSKGWKNQSVVDSSFDLWLDGYQPGIPDKKVSIYNRGALLSFCLDLALMQAGSSLSGLMRILYDTYGKTNLGYSLGDIRKVISHFDQPFLSWDSYFDDFIFGKQDLYPLVEKCLELLGIGCKISPKTNLLEGGYGILADGKGIVTKLHPEAESYRKLMLGDRVFSYSISEEGVSLHIIRQDKNLTVPLALRAESYFVDFELSIEEPSGYRDKWMK